MNHRQMRRQFGARPSLEAVLVYAVQHALKGFRIRHPDGKRQRCARLRAKEFAAARELKRLRVPLRCVVPPDPEARRPYAWDY